MKATIAAVFLFAPVWVFAHHGVGAQYDLSKTIELAGEIKGLLWRNPHVRITLGVVDDSGIEQLWTVEGQSVSMLRSRDITGNLFEIGDSILLAGNPAANGDTEIYANNILLPDGREVAFTQRTEPRWQDKLLGRTGPRFATAGDTSQPELGLFRAWSYAPGQSFFSGFDSSTYPMTNTARAAVESYDRSQNQLAMGECSAKGMPLLMANPYPRDFIDQGDVILLRLEEDDSVRTIHMTPIGSAEPELARLGYSLGHWDEDTLIVTTTKISDREFTRGILLGEDLKLVEYFTPSTDGSRLDYRMTLTDPTVFLEPLELTVFWIYLPTVKVEPYECLES